MKTSTLVALLLFPLCTALGKELSGERAAAATECPTPEEAQKKMTVPPGYEVRYFAHEPMVQNPVAMTWDHRGRLWVVELYEYPEGTPLPVEKRPFGGKITDGEYHPVPAVCQAKDNPLPQGTRPGIPKDRVIILEDTDNDGVADKRTVFVEGLDMGSAIVCGDGGIYVGQQPHLLHFKDTDGDDHADEWRVCLTGFGRDDTHELLNSFAWGPDGWLYMTHGVFTNSKVRRPGEPEDSGFKFDAGIGRCRPMQNTPEGKAAQWEFEVFADGTSNPWGCDYDSRGNYFVSACVIDHLFHMSPGGVYVRQGGAPENPYTYGLLPSIVDFKHFRAAYAGIQIYQSDRYPADTRGHLFIGNIHDNAIHEERVEAVGSTFKASPVRDFLRANDGWFRPVSTQTGPDGFLWVMDWCDKYPCYQNAKANPEGVDRARGRIWRVVNFGEKGGKAAVAQTREAKDLDLKKLSGTELVKLLEHPNSWTRRMARRVLAEEMTGSITDKETAQVLVPLEALAMTAAKADTQLELLWTLHQCGLLSGEMLDSLETHQDPGIRSWVARLSGERFRIAAQHLGAIADDDFMKASPAETASAERMWPETDRLVRLQKDPDITVRFSVAVGMRMTASAALTVDKELPHHEKMFRPMVRTFYMMPDLVKASGSSFDENLQMMLWMAIEPGLTQDPELAFMDGTLSNVDEWQPLSHKIVYKAMRRLCDSRDTQNLDLAMKYCEKIKAHDVLLARALEGLVKGQENGLIKPTVDVAPAFTSWRASASEEVRRFAQNLAVLWGDPVAIQDLVDKLVDAQTPAADRVAGLKALRKVKTDAARTGYAQLLGSAATATPALPEALIIEMLRAAPDLGDERTPDLLIALWKILPPVQRSALTEALVAREPWAVRLLEAVKAKLIPAADVPMTVVRKLSTHSNADMKKQAAAVFGVWRESNEDTRELISAKRKAALIGEPNIETGKVIFQGTCAICHTFHGGGQMVGPELIGSGRSNLDALLANVIDPNQIIGNGYEAINVTTRDNRLVTGRLIEDTPSHVKLLAVGGAEQIVSRDQIVKLENTHQSLMPMGFGALPDEAFRDLVWYILAPPEEGPLTKEKKDSLSAKMDAASSSSSSDGKPKSNRAIDWESISLWNPAWKVTAPDFERTPVKLPDFHGRRNVLLMHPFSEKLPATLERAMTLEPGKPHQLTATVAAHDQGDWKLRVLVNGEVIKEEIIGHEGERWKTATVDLSPYADGKDVNLRLEAAATGWAWEFGYWAEVKVE